MSISRDEASRALGEIEQARDRLREVTSYGYAAPHMMLWGLAWLVADVATQVGPLPVKEWTWPIVSSVCALISIVIVVISRNRAGPAVSRRVMLQVYGVMAAVVAFTAALIFVCWPLNPKQTHSLFGVIFGFAYVIEGLWLGWRLTVLGLALVALTLGAFVWLPLMGGYLVTMGVVGGGSLILGGLWLRRI
jgi:hypothetical protein